MAGVLVRLAVPADVEPAIAVWRAASAAYHGGGPASRSTELGLRGSAQQPDAFLLVAEVAGQVVGMGLARQGLADGAGPPVPGLCFLSMIAVAPDRWGEGVGGRVVDAVLAEARVRGYTRAQLWTRAANVRAHRLYERRGFRRTGRQMQDERGEPIVQYERAL